MVAIVRSTGHPESYFPSGRQHRLYFLPLPQGQVALRPILRRLMDARGGLYGPRDPLPSPLAAAGPYRAVGARGPFNAEDGTIVCLGEGLSVKLLAFAVVVTGLSLGCADIPMIDGPPVKAAIPATDLPTATPGVEAAKVPPTATTSFTPGAAFPNDRYPPERLPGSR
jgi:hypothetical protein